MAPGISPIVHINRFLDVRLTTDSDDDALRLDQFLKMSRLVQTGGHAKFVIQNGEVLVNGEVETRRRRKLKPADRVEFEWQILVVPTTEGTPE